MTQDIVTEGDAEQYVEDNPDEAVLCDSGPGRIWFVLRGGEFTVVRHAWIEEDAEEIPRKGAETDLPPGEIEIVDADDVPADGETLGADEDEFVHPIEQMLAELEEAQQTAEEQPEGPSASGGIGGIGGGL